MVRAVHRGAHEIVEAGVYQHEAVRADQLVSSHLAHEHARLGDEEPSRLELQSYGVTEASRDLQAGRVPQGEIVGGVDRAVFGAVRNAQASARRDGAKVTPRARKG